MESTWTNYSEPTYTCDFESIIREYNSNKTIA